MVEDGATVHEDEAEHASFAREKRWSLLSALAWIAARNMESAYRASRPGETIHKTDVSIAVVCAFADRQLIHRTVLDAWRLELAPAISDGHISGSGSVVAVDGARERREVGHTFPSTGRPREADHLEPIQRGHEVALSPRSSMSALTEWRDVIFSAKDILRLWPAENDAAQREDLVAIARILAQREAERCEVADLQAPDDAPVKRARPNAGELEADYLVYKERLERDPNRDEARAWRDDLPYRVTQEKVEAMRQKHLDAPLSAGRKPRSGF